MELLEDGQRVKAVKQLLDDHALWWEAVTWAHKFPQCLDALTTLEVRSPSFLEFEEHYFDLSCFLVQWPYNAAQLAGVNLSRRHLAFRTLQPRKPCWLHIAWVQDRHRN